MAGFGFTDLQTTLVSTCPAAAIQFLSFISFSYLASRFRNVSLLLCIASSIPPLVGATLLHVLSVDNQRGRLAGYYLTYTYVDIPLGLFACSFTCLKALGIITYGILQPYSLVYAQHGPNCVQLRRKYQEDDSLWAYFCRLGRRAYRRTSYVTLQRQNIIASGTKC